MYQSEIFFAEVVGVGDNSSKNNNMIPKENHHINPASNPTVDMNYVNLLRENFELRERNNQLIKLNNTLMIEISQLKLEIDMLELKKALAQEDR